ncbi:MAG: hypothetical protein SGJ21_07145 [Alphaproteobacteria bacterium]|nr:hypothetical protein [Alphaproteobacteria bacterium]
MRLIILATLAGACLSAPAGAQTPGNWWYLKGADYVLGWGDNEIDYSTRKIKGRRFVLLNADKTTPSGAYRWMSHEYFLDCPANTFALASGQLAGLDRQVFAETAPVPLTPFTPDTGEWLLKVAMCDAREIQGEQRASSMAEAMDKAEAIVKNRGVQ